MSIEQSALRNTLRNIKTFLLFMLLATAQGFMFSACMALEFSSQFFFVGS